ncbi:MAG: complement C1q domain-containing protein [Spirosomaceae bacterium]|jgi:hypothetical protein|nr:complement C1q domain-containing protein [Spirosomataceae bacterium]
MKKLFILSIIQISSFITYSQSISLDPNSLQLPRLAVNPTCAVADKGKLIYNTNLEKVLFCNGSAWQEINELTLPKAYSINSSSNLLEVNNTGSGTGIKGISLNSYGIFGQSTNGSGVYGNSTNNYGGFFSGARGVYASGSDWGLFLSGKLNLQGSLGATGNTIVVNSTGEPVWQPNVAFAVKDVGASSQAIPHNTDTKVNFDSEEYDLGSDFDPTTNLFTAPYTGIYHFDAAIMWDGPSNSNGILAITLRVNSTNQFTLRSPASQNQTPSNMLSMDIRLTAGQTVSIMAFQNTGTSQNINADNRTSRFSGRLITRL